MNSPFKGGLEKMDVPDAHSSEYGKFNKIEGREDLVIRRYMEHGSDWQKNTERFRKALSLIGDLRRFGIEPLSGKIVVGEASEVEGNNHDMYIVSDFVKGLPVFKLTGEQIVAHKEEIDTVLAGIANYYLDRLQQGRGSLLWDMHFKQFMLGKKKGDAEDHFYFVDIDPNVTSSDQISINSYFAQLVRLLVLLETDILDLEKISSVHFEKVREALRSGKSISLPLDTWDTTKDDFDAIVRHAQ